MQLRFPCTSYATLRFPNIFLQYSRHPSFLGKMKRSSSNSSVRRENVGADRTSLDVPENPDFANEKEFPSLSMQKSNHVPILLESPPITDSTSQLDERSLPTSFGKKNVPYPKRKSNFLRDYESRNHDPVEEPFDICLPRSRKFVKLKEKNEQNWVEIENSVEESKQVLRPGMVLLKSYLTMKEQVEIVKNCRELGLGSGGFYRPGYHDGAKLRLQMMCLGKNWDPQTKYKEERRKDGSEPHCIPIEFTSLVTKALEESNSLIKNHFGTISMGNTIPSITPDICIVNFYTANGRLGLHQDRDESEGSLHEGLPVVSLSVGDSAEFLYGDQRDVKKAENVMLESGDVLIFGGKSRHIFHGVSSIFPNSAPPDLLEKTMLRPGRLNLTFRQY